jgi:outer membrane immunogenic protein
MHKRLLLTNVLLAVMSAGAAHAADLPVMVEAPAPVLVEDAFNWSGFYAGIHGGYAWGESSYVDFVDAGPSDLLDTPEYDIEGGLVGLTLGYNMQVNNFVFGLEAEGSWADIDGSGTAVTEIPEFGPVESCVTGDNACTTEYKALGTVTARAGVAFDRALVFVKGGAAFGLAEYTAGAEDGDIDASFDETRFGWTVGGGVELALSQRISAKIEYNYIRFEDEVEFEASDEFGGTFFATGDVEDELHVVKAGINYHF